MSFYAEHLFCDSWCVMYMHCTVYSQVTLDLPRLPASAEQLRAAGGVFRQYHDMYTVITPR